MKTTFTFPTILTLALPLALLAQTKNEPNSPPAASRGRQAIISKLESIRLDTVRYDGLPLGEVVLNLRDEVKKRDPEKKGINFMINPNPPADSAPGVPPAVGSNGSPLPAPPREAVDISAIAVKINPPLSDVRLADVLDAVVKVADHPIKLDRIQLDTVHYDGLPLSEVVLNLRDEAKKRDPEKKGVNFMINPNPPADYAPGVAPGLGADGSPLPAPPQEAVDIGAITIKINPPLNDVRLVEVLDAVVKVADHPIRYSVEDYGVVISLQGPELARKEEIDFAFPGGTPAQFLDVLQQQYQVDWLSVADIPKEMADVRLPRLRINRGSLMAVGHGNDVGTDALGALVSLYNQLGEQKPELGRLIVRGDLTKPTVVMFVPNKALADTQPKIKVKAFSIYGINDAERTRLEEDVGRATKEAIDYALEMRGSSGPRSLEGAVAIHNGTSLLVATGTEAFVDMVESIVTACQAKERARNPGAPTALPAVPGR